MTDLEVLRDVGIVNTRFRTRYFFPLLSFINYYYDQKIKSKEKKKKLLS
jgi:hypothetical protein